jgi:threonine/homoserine/homoserine lactone efflux protein
MHGHTAIAATCAPSTCARETRPQVSGRLFLVNSCATGDACRARRDDGVPCGPHGFPAKRLPTLQALTLFLVVTAAYSVVPGPAVLLIVSRAMLYGSRIGAAAVAGITTMNIGFIVLAALGVGVLVEAFPSVFLAVQWIGAAYIVWIAVQTIRHPVTAEQVGTASDFTGTRGMPRSVRGAWLEGIAVQGSNPKAILYVIAFLPQFVDPAVGSVATQMAVLCGVGTLVDVVILAGYAWIGGRAVRWITRPGAAKAFAWIAGGLLMLAALGVAGIFQR